MEYFLTGFLLALEFTTFYNLNSAFLKRIESPIFLKRFIAFFLLSLTIQLYITVGFQLPIPPLMFNYLLFLTISFFTFKGSWKIKTVITATFLILLYAIDYILSYVLIFLGIPSQEIMFNPVLFIGVSFSSRFISILISFILKRIVLSKNNEFTISSKQWIQTFIYSATSLLTLYLIIMYALDTNSTDGVLVIYTTVVIISNVILFSIISQLEEDNVIRQQNALLNQQIKLGIENVNTLSQAYQKQRSMSHDFNSHLNIINSFLNDNNYEQAKAYSAKLINTVDSETNLFNSNNSIVDTLLMQKYLVAKTNDIIFQVNIDDLSDLPLSAEDLTVVLSNLIDNAIEAAIKCPHEKIIKIKIKKDSSGYILSVHNTTSRNISIENGEIITTKKDNLNHGYGIKNIKSVLKKYNYSYTITCNNDWFKFSIILF